MEKRKEDKVKERSQHILEGVRLHPIKSLVHANTISSFPSLSSLSPSEVARIFCFSSRIFVFGGCT